MKARLLALAILSTASAATFAGGLFHSDQDRTSGPNARVPLLTAWPLSVIRKVARAS